MNCYRYLSRWIHYASLLVTHFSLSYLEIVGLILGMYCEANPINFVLVAKDLLTSNDSSVKQYTVDFGLMV